MGANPNTLRQNLTDDRSNWRDSFGAIAFLKWSYEDGKTLDCLRYVPHYAQQGVWQLQL
jgi:hypothetical protein